MFVFLCAVYAASCNSINNNGMCECVSACTIQITDTQASYCQHDQINAARLSSP